MQENKKNYFLDEIVLQNFFLNTERKISKSH